MSHGLRVIAAVLVLAPAAAQAGLKYDVNGPNLPVPLVAVSPQGVKPWVQVDPTLAGTIVKDEVHPYLWTMFPAASGKLQLRVTRSTATKQIILEYGIMPDASSPNPPSSLAIYGFKQLNLEIGRSDAGEAVAPKTRVRSEQNQQTKLYHLVFEFDTPLPKGKMTWFSVKTLSTAVEPGAMATFADNDSPTSGWPQFPFVRPVPTRVPPARPPEGKP